MSCATNCVCAGSQHATGHWSECLEWRAGADSAGWQFSSTAGLCVEYRHWQRRGRQFGRRAAAELGGSAQLGLNMIDDMAVCSRCGPAKMLTPCDAWGELAESMREMATTQLVDWSQTLVNPSMAYHRPGGRRCRSYCTGTPHAFSSSRTGLLIGARRLRCCVTLCVCSPRDVVMALFCVPPFASLPSGHEIPQRLWMAARKIPNRDVRSGGGQRAQKIGAR